MRQPDALNSTTRPQDRLWRHPVDRVGYQHVSSVYRTSQAVSLEGRRISRKSQLPQPVWCCMTRYGSL
jgi:hypothetical protein